MKSIRNHCVRHGMFDAYRWRLFHRFFFFLWKIWWYLSYTPLRTSHLPLHRFCCAWTFRWNSPELWFKSGKEKQKRKNFDKEKNNTLVHSLSAQMKEVKQKNKKKIMWQQTINFEKVLAIYVWSHAIHFIVSHLLAVFFFLFVCLCFVAVRFTFIK